MSLASALKEPRSGGRCGFIPFITAGDPSLDATARFVRALARAGADIIELGVPFSDPIGDGPVIQAADERALKAGGSLAKTLLLVRRLRRRGETVPLILFTYFNPVLNMGLNAFAAACARAGVQGVLIVDLPAEEAQDAVRALRRKGVEPVLLASPTTTDRRLGIIGRLSGSLVYYVSRVGVTGVRSSLPSGLAARIRRVREKSGKSVIVGFGVSTASQAKALAPHADGVVVGSALVAEISGKPVARAQKDLSRLTRRIIKGI